MSIRAYSILLLGFLPPNSLSVRFPLLLRRCSRFIQLYSLESVHGGVHFSIERDVVNYQALFYLFVDGFQYIGH